MPTDPTVPTIERPKCYADPCGRQLNGNCVCRDCPVVLSAVPDAPPPGGLPIVETGVKPLDWHPTPEADALAKLMAKAQIADALDAAPRAAVARRMRVGELTQLGTTPADRPHPVDPRDEKAVCVLQSWVIWLPLRHQGVLLTAVRGCDMAPKNDPSKLLARAFRAVVLNPFCRDANKAATFITPATGATLRGLFDGFRKNCDHYPHHYVMHMVHAAQIVGCHHFDEVTRAEWWGFYCDLARGLHMNVESAEELRVRLTRNEAEFAAEDKR